MARCTTDSRPGITGTAGAAAGSDSKPAPLRCRCCCSNCFRSCFLSVRRLVLRSRLSASLPSESLAHRSRPSPCTAGGVRARLRGGDAALCAPALDCPFIKVTHCRRIAKQCAPNAAEIRSPGRVSQCGTFVIKLAQCKSRKLSKLSDEHTPCALHLACLWMEGDASDVGEERRATTGPLDFPWLRAEPQPASAAAGEQPAWPQPTFDDSEKRPKYRASRNPKAVKAYSVVQESRCAALTSFALRCAVQLSSPPCRSYLVVRNVPALGVIEDLIKRLAVFGAIEEFVNSDGGSWQCVGAHCCFAQVPHTGRCTRGGVHGRGVGSLRGHWQSTVRHSICASGGVARSAHPPHLSVAKQRMNRQSFFGHALHVMYGPEYESVADMRDKLLRRVEDVRKRTGGGCVACLRAHVYLLSVLRSHPTGRVAAAHRSYGSRTWRPRCSSGCAEAAASFTRHARTVAGPGSCRADCWSGRAAGTAATAVSAAIAASASRLRDSMCLKLPAVRLICTPVPGAIPMPASRRC